MVHSVDPALAHLIFESATEFAIITTDLDGCVTSWNPGATAIFRWSVDEAIGMRADAIFTPEDRRGGAPQNEMDRSLADGRAVDERWHIRKNGSRFWGSGLMMPLRESGDDDHRGFLKMVYDRTAERNAESRYHAMSMALPGFVFIADSDGNITESNERYRSFTGFSEEELMGDGWLAAVHEDDRQDAAERWANAIRSGLDYETRLRFRGADGNHRCFACRGVPERDEQGRVIRWLGTCIDVENEARALAALQRLSVNLEHRVTQGDADLASAIEELQAEILERTRAEEALRQAQKMEAVGQLTGGVAHDFNNLLTVIRSSADLLRLPDLPEDKRKRYLDAIADTADRAAALTGQLLAFARRQPLQPKLFDAAEQLRDVAEMLDTTVGSRMQVKLIADCAPCRVNADANQFETAIMNLVVNARDAMGGEGTVRIELEEVDRLPPRRGHAASSGAFIAVSVTDEGSGIASDRIGRIFEPFYTTKEVGKGTGLGLSQVFGFAKQSGGDVVVESQEGSGTRFTLYLPKAKTIPKADTAADTPSIEAPPPAIGERCVLIVEDNQAVGAFAGELLEELGYSVTWVGTASAALDLVRDNPDRYDIVFSDVVMPGMTGVELAMRLREEFPTLPVVLTSGYSNVVAEEGTRGFELLRKPYSVDALARFLGRGKRPM